MDVWQYEQTDFPTEWEAKVFGSDLGEHTRDMWAVSVRGQVFTGFKTRREARGYGKHIVTNGMDGLPPAVSRLACLPKALADAYRTCARRDGYAYDPMRLAWVKALGDTLTSGFYDDNTYPEAGEIARQGMEPEIATLLELIEEHMETILANVRAGQEGPAPSTPVPWSPQDHPRRALMVSSAALHHDQPGGVSTLSKNR